MSDAEPAWRVTNATKAPANGPWLCAVTITTGRIDGTVLHVARVSRDGRVWMPAALPAEMRVEAIPAVAKAALALLGEGRE